jgi:hypothetical protein
MSPTIGFFGDSFCAEQYNDHSLENNYDTYISLLSKHYDAEIVNLGHMGSSIYDTILIQLQPFISKNQVPDICVFCWTSGGRLFHPTVRNINASSLSKYKINIENFSQSKVWRAAGMFYQELFDSDKDFLEYRAMLKYIDECILTTLPPGTRIVNLWSFGLDWRIDNPYSNPHEWKTGSEIITPLLAISTCDFPAKNLSNDPRCNHLDGQYKNNLVFEWIKQAIDSPGQRFDHSESIAKLYTHS